MSLSLAIGAVEHVPARRANRCPLRQGVACRAIVGNAAIDKTSTEDASASSAIGVIGIVTRIAVSVVDITVDGSITGFQGSSEAT